ncbi:unnamed protein product [Clavelina lepadiformis]|uniref:Uncharacterized protein n=1 Tax=Clavelina lepadiformis TaxID=159417 RepID=A0ABP0FSB9_CLALP
MAITSVQFPGDSWDTPKLLSQLSGVRRSAQQLQQNVTTASQLQELQTQLQLERQRAADIRQQLHFDEALTKSACSVLID